jgi:peptide/nickel transport system ATP-binding protein
VKVGLEEEHFYRYPHEFSGGQRQRIGIARALAVEPELIICDEPTSALDVTVRSQVLELLKSLQQEQGLSYLFITHDLSIIRTIADEVAVMREGKIVEHGVVDEVMSNPQHEYTQKLLSSAPLLPIQ